MQRGEISQRLAKLASESFATGASIGIPCLHKDEEHRGTIFQIVSCGKGCLAIVVSGAVDETMVQDRYGEGIGAINQTLADILQRKVSMNFLTDQGNGFDRKIIEARPS